MTRMLGMKAAIVFSLVAIVMAMPVSAAPPTLVVSVKSVDELLDDADFIGEVVGFQGLKEIADQYINAFTANQGLAGLDREKSLGLYWNIPEKAPEVMGSPVLFLPISDEEAFKGLIQMYVPDFKDTDGHWTLTVQGQEVFAKVVNGYCFASTSEKELTNISDPSKILNSAYDIAINVNLASIPKSLKANFLEQVESGTKMQIENGPQPKDEASAAGQKMGVEWSLAIIKALTNDGDVLTFGLNVDDDTRLASFDLGLTGRANTPLAKALATYGKTIPAFAAVATDSAPFLLTFSFPTTGIESQFDEFLNGIKKSTDAEIEKDEKLTDGSQKTAAKDVAARLLNIAQATVKSGSLQAIVLLEEGEEDTVRVVGGSKLAKGNDAAKLFDEIVTMSKESPEFAKLKVDVAKHAGARIHSVEGDYDDKQAALFGNSPGHIAFRPDSLWFSLGGGNLEALKTALDQSGKNNSKPTAPISLRTKPATLVTLMEQDNEALVKRAEALAGEPGDVMNLDISPADKGGIKVHFVFGVDLIKLGIDK